jgi:hypothetical protein
MSAVLHGISETALDLLAKQLQPRHDPQTDR